MTNGNNQLLVVFCNTNIDMIVLCCYLINIIENKNCKLYSILLSVIMVVCYTDV